jgi:FdhE protein
MSAPANFVLPSTVAPTTWLPPRAGLFGERAARLRHLAAMHPMGDWLRAVAQLCDAQQRLDGTLNAFVSPTGDALSKLPAVHAALLQALSEGEGRALAEGITLSADLNARAQCLLAYTHAEPDASGPQDRADLLLGASLQLLFTAVARQTDVNPVLSPVPGEQRCPCCGSVAHAGVVLTADGKAGLRYLECSLCATRWHAVRARCTLCDSPREVEYRGLEGAHPGVQAETCDACHGYVKTLFRDKDPHTDPLADDLATLVLDVLVGEAGYGRASPCLLLIHTDPTQG